MFLDIGSEPAFRTGYHTAQELRLPEIMPDLPECIFFGNAGAACRIKRVKNMRLQLPPDTTMSLKKNEKAKFLIGVSVPKEAEKGTYIYQVTVSFDSKDDDTLDTNEYDNPLQMIVKVP